MDNGLAGRDVSETRYSGFTLVADGLREAVKSSSAKLVKKRIYLGQGDTAILIVGESPMAEFEGDLDTTDFRELSTLLCAKSKGWRAEASRRW